MTNTNTNTNTTRPTKSEIFTAYNKARAHARKAGSTKQIERLNKALGILLSNDYYQADTRTEYQPTTYSCGCKDWQYRHAARRDYHGICKHMEAERMLQAIHTRRTEHLFTIQPIHILTSKEG